MGELFSESDVVALGVVAAVVVVYLIIIGLGVANYVMTSIALYRIANRRQIANPWMAWVPYASYWIIGRIADDYDERNGIKRKWRVALLTLTLIMLASLIFIYVFLIVSITAYTLLSDGAEIGETGLAWFMIGVYIVYIVLMVVALALTACSTICIFKIFESTVPEKALKYLLLYMMVPLAGAVCLLKCKEKGYSKPAAEVCCQPE